jgi:tRNA(fMet)-specific endonuclease VapC
MICLDTNVLIAAINLRPAGVRARLDAEILAGTTIGIPAIALFEMRYGASKSIRRAQSDAALDAFLSLAVTPWSFEQEDATHAGEIRAELERAGNPIGWYDYLIAAQARRRGAVLVTANKREFGRVPGLVVQDWGAA